MALTKADIEAMAKRLEETTGARGPYVLVTSEQQAHDIVGLPPGVDEWTSPEGMVFRRITSDSAEQRGQVTDNREDWEKGPRRGR